MRPNEDKNHRNCFEDISDINFDYTGRVCIAFLENAHYDSVACITRFRRTPGSVRHAYSGYLFYNTRKNRE
jgi:hypothetical protein